MKQSEIGTAFSSDTPLSHRMRPSGIDDIVGQEHLTGPSGVLRKALEKNIIPNMIFYGPPGVGKTTAANVIAKTANKSIQMLNATYSKTEEVRDILKNSKEGNLFRKDILYIDEIQSFNKKQQQIMLEYIEQGDIVLIASTTENPYHYVYKALLSRCIVLEFRPIDERSVKKNLLCIIERLNQDGMNITYEEEALDNMAVYADGDVRKSLNLLELILQLYGEDDQVRIDRNLLKNLNISKQLAYDINGDSHYDILSAFQKSIRGSDPDAALHYLARLIKSEDLKSICRRLLVTASEDIGLAYPAAVGIVKSCVDSALHLGFPEATIPLSQAVILLSMSPKSNSAYRAVSKALRDLEKKSVGDVPVHLKDSHYQGAKELERGLDYKYPHDYESHYTEQEYLPKELRGRTYYEAQDNKFERGMRQFIDTLKEKSKKDRPEK